MLSLLTSASVVVVVVVSSVSTCVPGSRSVSPVPTLLMLSAPPLSPAREV